MFLYCDILFDSLTTTKYYIGILAFQRERERLAYQTFVSRIFLKFFVPSRSKYRIDQRGRSRRGGHFNRKLIMGMEKLDERRIKAVGPTNGRTEKGIWIISQEISVWHRLLFHLWTPRLVSEIHKRIRICGKFYKITGHLRNYTFHGMLVAFHWWPTTIPSVAIFLPSILHPRSPLSCSNPLEHLSILILFIIESPSLPPKKTNEQDQS